MQPLLGQTMGVALSEQKHAAPRSPESHAIGATLLRSLLGNLALETTASEDLLPEEAGGPNHKALPLNCPLQ